MVAMTRYFMARTRSDVLRPSFLKAFVASLRASSNLFFAVESFLVADSSRPVSSNLLIPSIIGIASLQAACAVTAPHSPLVFAILNTSYNNTIPSSKKLMLASKSFLDNASNFDLMSSISLTIKEWNF